MVKNPRTDKVRLGSVWTCKKLSQSQDTKMLYMIEFDTRLSATHQLKLEHNIFQLFALNISMTVDTNNCFHIPKEIH